MEALIRNPVTPASEPTKNGSLGLGIFSNDVGYVATVQIGNPPRDFTLLVDSGSADTWVPLDKCLTEDGKHPCGNHTSIGKNSSMSLKSTDERWSIVYGSGSTEGILVTDDLVLAGQTITGHKFGAATVESKEFADAAVKYDGVMGTARSTSASQRTETPVEALARIGFIEQAITSYKLGRIADDANDGEVTFGGMNTSKFNQTTLITVPSVSDAFWAATLEVASVQGAHLLQVQNRTAILDTGTTLLLVPPQDAAQIHSRIDGARLNADGTGYVLPCTTDASVALRFGGHDFAIDSRDLAFAPLDPRNLTGMCTSGIASRDLFGDGTWLVGDTFLKSVYFSHNADTNEVSLAELL
ncbi:acid protease [Cylindrobasidium torrendii FP15055 ss-10]|uniref:Acid protease n=1 Tax=Cylindrobasidium torrendii FP15055 ss-10 TaxID=1314674 RepID=A0A0D7B309_9AGAR|nr:acid protease [Cylindrobasidium torrendii FP15055 ss-10]